MVFSYEWSVVLVSLALYGGWCFLKDFWEYYIEPQFMHMPSASFLVIVKDMEQDIELLLRYLCSEVEPSTVEYDVVVVDCCSIDLTPEIISRLAEEHELVRLVNLPEDGRPVEVGFPLCRGSVVHVLDLTARVDRDYFMATVCALISRDQREVRIKKEA